MAFLSRKRHLLPFLIPLLLALVFFSLTAETARRAPWYVEVFWNLLTPPQRIVTGMSDTAHGAWRHYVALMGAQRESERLGRTVAELQGEVVRLNEVRQENDRLRALLAFQETIPQRTIVARVIANDPRAEFKSIMISRGARDGIEPLMPVVGPRGLVGRVGEVAARTSRVLLIVDPNSAVDAMVQRSRARGLIVGALLRTEFKHGFYLARLEYLRRVSDIRDGDVVVTSGLDRVFPPGIPVGTVSEVSTSRYGVFTEATVVPFENMAELQEVLVIASDMPLPGEADADLPGSEMSTDTSTSRE